jgi:methyl-accepting chemotaxis protein
MTGSWTFGQKIGWGFAAVVLLAVLIGGIAIYALNWTVSTKDEVIELDAGNLIAVERLRTAGAQKASSSRGYLLTGDDKHLEELRSVRAEFRDLVGHIRGRLRVDQARRLLDDVERAENSHQMQLDRLMVLRRGDTALPEIVRQFDVGVLPVRETLDRSLSALAAFEQQLMDTNKGLASEGAAQARMAVVAVSLLAVLFAFGMALLLTQTLSRQIGAAVQHVQSSCTELQTAANQQATGSREQATAMTEITTTISELLATSRQIASSADRVSKIAEETATAARSGERTVQTTAESMTGIKRQVDLIVMHMLDLGKKSQQIGGILEIINELAEQTNILAINATIEAAGAGDSGKRFGVVADEIRKLADRVGGSTKEIRSLIDEIRAAVNTTVMTTESGTKAVDLGGRQFADVTAALGQIASLVGTTTEAAREIGLSTKQQSTAVEQVNVAVSNVAQAARESEASSTQTFQTASQLTSLARELTRLIQPQASA